MCVKLSASVDSDGSAATNSVMTSKAVSSELQCQTSAPSVEFHKGAGNASIEIVATIDTHVDGSSKKSNGARRTRKKNTRRRPESTDCGANVSLQKLQRFVKNKCTAVCQV